MVKGIQEIHLCATMTVSYVPEDKPGSASASLLYRFKSRWHILRHDQSSDRVRLGRWLGLDVLRHLLGTVVGQTQAHDGQHHGYLVDGTVLRLRLHFTGNLPL